jgi:hypothetical protein
MNPTDKTEQPDGSLTREQFCELENISLSTFHKIKRAGKGPAEMRFPRNVMRQD